MKADDQLRSPTRWLRRPLWIVAVLLVIIGVGAGIGRSVFTADFVTRVDPGRQWLMDVLHRDAPFALQRPEELARVDGRFAAHPLLTRLHSLAGGIFFLVAPFQFSARIRGRHTSTDTARSVPLTSDKVSEAITMIKADTWTGRAP